MPRQCHNPKCIGSKKSLTSRKCKNKEKDPRPPSTSRRSSSDNSTASRNKRTQKRKKSKRSRDGSKNSRTRSNESRNCKNTTSTESKTFGRVSGSSRDCKKQICTCREEPRGTRSGNSHGHAKRRTPAERSKTRRKRSRRRRKKASKRESDRPRHDCFTTLCVCVRGRSSDELRACKCTSSYEIPSHRECSVKDGQEVTKRATRRNILKSDAQVDRYTAGPSTSERKPALKHSRELSPAKLNEERSVIIRGLNTVRRGIDRFSARAIKLLTRQ